MLVLLLRHAEAASRDAERYPDDSLRPLVRKGEKIQRAVSKDLRKRELIPSRVFSSPWKRAWQTARILVDETGVPKKARIACPRSPVRPTSAPLPAAIGPLTPDGTIALVGPRSLDRRTRGVAPDRQRRCPALRLRQERCHGDRPRRIHAGRGDAEVFPATVGVASSVRRVSSWLKPRLGRCR